MNGFNIGLVFVLGGLIFLAVFLVGYWVYKTLSRRAQQKYMPKKARHFKCLDGHLVRSKGEMIIDNHLTRLGIEHEYEQTIRVRGEPIKYDWYLPEYDVYMEYWGYYGKDYMERKEDKLRLYAKGKLDLISIENIMFEDLYANLERALKEFGDLDQKITARRFCPKCGERLDDRFSI